MKMLRDRRRMTAVAVVVVITLSACNAGDSGYRAVGQLESDRVELVAEASEPIISLPVREGESVTAGTAVVVQDPLRQLAAKAEANAGLAIAEARLAELQRGPRAEKLVAQRAQVQRAKDDVAFRQREFQRAETLLERKLMSPEAVDQAQAALDTATADLRFQRATLAELDNGTTLEELKQAEATVEQARARVGTLEVNLQRLTLSAPATAIVDSLVFEPGERPMAGQVAAVLLTGEQPYARVYINEKVRVQISPGAAATVYVDGLESALAGRVRWIANEATFTPYLALTRHDRGRLAYVAKIDLDYFGERLPDGVPVEVEFAAAP